MQSSRGPYDRILAQETLCFLWKSQIQYRVYNSSTLSSVAGKMNPVYFLESSYLTFILILYCHLRQGVLSVSFILSVSYNPHVLRVTPIALSLIPLTISGKNTNSNTIAYFSSDSYVYSLHKLHRRNWTHYNNGVIQSLPRQIIEYYTYER